MNHLLGLCVAIVALSACGDSSVHDVVECDVIGADGLECEYGCRRGQPTFNAGACYASNPNDEATILCSASFHTDGSAPSARGCCRPVGGMLRFYECCAPVLSEDGASVECP